MPKLVGQIVLGIRDIIGLFDVLNSRGIPEHDEGLLHLRLAIVSFVVKSLDYFVFKVLHQVLVL